MALSYTSAMSEYAEVQRSVSNIRAMFTFCAIAFGLLIARVLPRIFPTVSELSDSGKPKEQLIFSVKIVALLMAVPVVFFLCVLLGEFPILWHAFPMWCISVGLLFVALGCLIFALFWLDREDIEDYSIESDRRAAFDTKMKKQDAEKRVVLVGFGLWIVGLGASYFWLMQLASIPLRDAF